MSILVDQFCSASLGWAKRTGEPDHAIAYWVMEFTGGAYHYDPVGIVDQSGLSEEQRKRLLLGRSTGIPRTSR